MKNLLVLLVPSAMAFTALTAQPGSADKASGSSPLPSAIAARTQSRIPAQQGLPTLPLMSRQTVNYSSLARRTPLSRPQARLRAPMRVPESFPQLNGVIAYSKGWGSDNLSGMYSISLGVEPATQLLGLGVPCGSNGAVVQDGVFYTQDTKRENDQVIGISLNAYDTTTWELLAFWDYNPDLMTYYSVAQDPTTDYIYGIVAGGDNGLTPVWARLDFAESSVTPLTSAATPMYLGLGFTNDGECYGVYNGADGHSRFAKVNKANGQASDIATLPRDCAYLCSGCLDSGTGRFFMNVYDAAQDSYILEIDPSTGEVVYECQMPDGDQILALYSPKPVAEAGAPGECNALSLEFPDGAMTGVVAFKVPQTTFDGNAASDEPITYHVLANGQEVASGQTSYGEDVAVELTMEAVKQYEFVVYCSNEAGRGPKIKASMFIGNDTPLLQGGIARYEDGEFTVEWDAVSQGANGGALDPELVTYTVKMYPQGETVAEGIKETRVVVPMDCPDEISSFYFTIQAGYRGAISSEHKTNSIVLGSIVPPYAQHFDDASAFDLFTVLNCNNDGNAWSWYDGKARLVYNSSLAMDDWLITPPVRLEGGKAYKVGFGTWSISPYFPEKIEACWGVGKTPEEMSHVLVEPTTVATVNLTDKEALRLGGYLVPETDGIYYIGFHGISDPYTYFLYVDDITVDSGIDTRVPGAAQIAATPDTDGELSVQIRVSTPSVNFIGTQTTDPMSVILKRNGETVSTQEGVSPGAAVLFDDAPEAGGMVQYTAVCQNAYGQSLPVTEEVFVGVPIPAAPQNVQIAEIDEGCVKITWDPVALSLNGVEIDPSKVKYMVLDQNKNIVADNISECEASTRAVAQGEQDFVYYGVYGITNGGAGAVASTAMIPVGAPTPAPYSESGLAKNIIGTSGQAGAGWGGLTDAAYAEIDSQDEDGIFYACQGLSTDIYSDLFTGKIAIGDIPAPTLSFYAYNMQSLMNEGDVYDNTLTVSVLCDGVKTDMPTIELGNLPMQGWNKMTYPLEDYAGKTIQVFFRGNIVSYSFIFMDNIRVYSLYDHNISAGHLTAPTNIHAGEDFDITLRVGNTGAQPANGYTVEAYCNGKLVETQQGEELQPDQSVKHTFTCSLNPTDSVKTQVTARIVWDQDEYSDDNEASPVTVEILPSGLPAPQGLTGEVCADGNKLAWQAPDLTAAYTQVNEGFEDAEAWSVGPQGWTVFDNDHLTVGGFNNIPIPGWTIGVSMGTWKVFDTTDKETYDFDWRFATHGGSRFIGSIYANGGANDEWLISPELYGGEQMITFWAKGFDTRYDNETLRVLYSTTGTAIDDFTTATGASELTVPGEWTRFTVSLPQGAKYFAINHVSNNKFFVMVDDISFMGAISDEELTIQGYNIYRDGSLAATVQDTTYLDADNSGRHTYAVTALYAKGEGDASESLTLEDTQIGIGAIKAEGAVSYYDLMGRRVGNPEHGVFIRLKDGQASKVKF